MKSYTVKDPVFSESMMITETTDTDHADNINAAPKQLLANTLALRQEIRAGRPEDFSGTKNYQKGDRVTKDGEVYLAPEDIPAGEWDESRWTRTNPYMEAADIRGQMDAHLTDTSNPHGLTAGQLGLGSVDNTPDTEKPVSTAQGAAIDAAYRQGTGYTDKKIADLINGAPSTLDTLGEIARAMGENADVVEALHEAVGKKADAAELESHENNTTVHVTASERAAWDGKMGKTGDSADNTASFASADETSPTAWTDMEAVRSGERHGSLFRKLSLAIKNIRYLYRTLGSADISGIADGTVTGGICRINASLTASGGEEFRFGVDADGNYGYIKAGADTVTPFSDALTDAVLIPIGHRYIFQAGGPYNPTEGDWKKGGTMPIKDWAPDDYQRLELGKTLIVTIDRLDAWSEGTGVGVFSFSYNPTTGILAWSCTRTLQFRTSFGRVYMLGKRE